MPTILAQKNCKSITSSRSSPSRDLELICDPLYQWEVSRPTNVHCISANKGALYCHICRGGEPPFTHPERLLGIFVSVSDVSFLKGWVCWGKLLGVKPKVWSTRVNYCFNHKNWLAHGKTSRTELLCFLYFIYWRAVFDRWVGLVGPVNQPMALLTKIPLVDKNVALDYLNSISTEVALSWFCL